MVPNYQDDDFNPQQYVDGGRTEILPLPAEYRIKAVSAQIKKDKEGNTVISKDDQGREFRTVRINRIEIVEPADDNGQFGIFADVGSRPFPRKGAGQTKVMASKVMDVIRAIDLNLAGEPQGWDDAADVLLRELQSGAEFHVKLGYKSLDVDGAKADLASLDENASQDEKNEVWRKHTYYTSAYRNADGSYNTSVKSKDDQRFIPAKLTIESFVPVNKRRTPGK